MEGQIERIAHRNVEVVESTGLSAKSVASNVVDIRSGRQARALEGAARIPEWGGFEPFVDEHVVADFLGIKPRRVVEMARKKLIPAHPIGGQRKTWRFRISEIDAHFSLQKEKQATIGLAVPVTRERKRHG